MPKLIDANVLMESRPEYLNPNHETNGDYNKGWNACNSEYYRLIQETPTVDAVELMHGRWIGSPILREMWKCRCDQCGCPQDYEHNYCPNCGAKMDGDVDG